MWKITSGVFIIINFYIKNSYLNENRWNYGKHSTENVDCSLNENPISRRNIKEKVISWRHNW